MQIQEERIEKAKVPVEEPKTKTAEVQTIFRDSEAQTNPYSPEYIIDKENVPEVLSIANFMFGKLGFQTVLWICLLIRHRYC